MTCTELKKVYLIRIKIGTPGGDYESTVKIQEFNMVDPIWQTKT